MDNIKVSASGVICAIDHFNKKDSQENVIIINVLITDRIKADIVKFIGEFEDKVIEDLTNDLHNSFIDCILTGTYNTKYVTYDTLSIPTKKIVLKRVV